MRMSEGVVIAYRLWRPGPTRRLLVLLHGVASNMTRWSEFVAATTLRASWDLLRVDLRGHGLSLHRGRIGMPEWCADLATILAAEGYAHAVVAGHCLGANIAIEFAVRYPAKSAGLVLIEPMFRAALTGHMRQTARFRSLFLPAAGFLRALNALGIHRRRLAPLDLEALDRKTRGAIARGGTADALLAQYASPLLDLRTTPSLAYLRGLIAVTRRLPELSAITAPVLALLATGSSFSDPIATEAALAALPHLQLVKLPARHWIPTEAPEAMRLAIERWCTALPADF
jgi:pimeloyl-ACP methyl ester carboxylesterase